MSQALRFLENADTASARAALRQANDLIALARQDENTAPAKRESYSLASSTTILAIEILDEQPTIFQEAMTAGPDAGIGAALKAIEDANMEAIVAVEEAQGHLADAMAADRLGTAWMAGAAATMLIGLFVGTFAIGGQTLFMGPTGVGLIDADGWLTMATSAAGAGAAVLTKQVSKHDASSASGTTMTGTTFTLILAVMAVASAL